MRVERLEVVDFRNHDAAAVELPAGVSVLVGPNGVGKTNLLEAVGYLATLGSHRVGQDASLIRVGAASAVIRAAVRRAGRRLLVDVELRPGSGVRGRVNGAPVPRARDLLGVVRATMFAPEDLGLVRGDPEERRRFLDTLATQRLPRYHGSRQDYDRVLRQRNTLLRSAGGRLPAAALATLEVWDEKLASAGAEIWSERLRLVAALTPRVELAYHRLAGRDDGVDVAYVSSVAGPGAARPGAARAAGRRPRSRGRAGAHPVRPAPGRPVTRRARAARPHPCLPRRGLVAGPGPPAGVAPAARRGGGGAGAAHGRRVRRA